MNPKGWNELVDQVRKQIEDVNNTLVCRNDRLPLDAVADAKRNIEQLIHSQANPREAFYQLPLILRSLSNHNLMGALVLDVNSKVALHDGDMKEFWPFDARSQTLRSDCFYHPDEPLPIARVNLPWYANASREIVATSLQLLCRDAGKVDLQTEVTVVPLACGGKFTGEVMLLFRDLSDSLKADQYVKNLCRVLENQVSAMESAQRELKLLVDKLSADHVPVENVLLPPADVPPAPGAQSSILKRPPLEKRVLVVDDIPVNQKVLIMHLNKLGVSADAANNGLEAVSACKNKRYSLVLMDLDMPILNGLEATVDIRKFEQALGVHTPIIAMTSFDRPGDKERCVQAGMDDFLGKSDSKAQLHEVVNRYVFGAVPGDSGSSCLPVYKDEKKPGRHGLELDLAWIKEALGQESMEVVSQFIFTASSLMERLKLVIEEKNALQVTHVAYSLKGPCSNLGLTLMAKLCAEIADDAFMGGWKQTEEKFQVLRKMFSAVQEQAGNLSDARPEKKSRF